MLHKIYLQCSGTGLALKLSKSATNLYKSVHDEIIEFRRKDSFEEDKLSIKSKSLGQILRVSAIICLLREAVSTENEEMSNVITKDDFEMAKNIMKHSNDTRFALIEKSTSSALSSKTIRQKIPLPENLNIDFLVQHNHIVKRLLIIFILL